jgi:hypothetical protein
MSPVLKLFQELVEETRNRRLDFGHRASGVVLFRAVAAAMASYLPKIVAAEVRGDVWRSKLKGINQSLAVCNAALSCGWVNFGVMRLYGDDSLKRLLDAVVTVAVTMPIDGALEYAKLGETFFSTLKTLFEHHMEALLLLPPDRFFALLGALKKGVAQSASKGGGRGRDTVSSESARAVEHFASFCYTEGRKSGETAQRLKTHVAARPTIFKEFLKLLLDTMLYTERTNTYTLARPMFSLILVASDDWGQVKADLAAGQTPEVQSKLAASFRMLQHTDLRPNLEAFNVKLFARLLLAFKVDVLGYLAV